MVVVPRVDAATTSPASVLDTAFRDTVSEAAAGIFGVACNAWMRTATVPLFGRGPDADGVAVMTAFAEYALAGESADMRWGFAWANPAGALAVKWAVRIWPNTERGVASPGVMTCACCLTAICSLSNFRESWGVTVATWKRIVAPLVRAGVKCKASWVVPKDKRVLPSWLV